MQDLYVWSCAILMTFNGIYFSRLLILGKMRREKSQSCELECTAPEENNLPCELNPANLPKERGRRRGGEKPKILLHAAKAALCQTTLKRLRQLAMSGGYYQ